MSIGPCVSTPPVHGVVIFEPTVFVVEYPQFAGLTNAAMIKAFRHATLQLDNSCGSLVRNAYKREILLGLLTAHILFLNNGTNDGAGNITPPTGAVGRLASATEGSVTAALEYNAPPNASQAWLIQTTYGSEYWSATAKYRTFRYVAVQQNPTPGLWGPWGG